MGGGGEREKETLRKRERTRTATPYLTPPYSPYPPALIATDICDLGGNRHKMVGPKPGEVGFVKGTLAIVPGDPGGTLPSSSFAQSPGRGSLCHILGQGTEETARALQ